MKILSAVFLALFLFLFSGCEKSVESQNAFTSDDTSDVHSGKPCPVQRPMKVNVTALANDVLPPVKCLPETYGAYFVGGGGWVKGNVSHLGKVNTEASAFIVTDCYLGPDVNQVTELVSGTITGANGECIYYTGSATVTLTDSSLKGIINLNGGTGKFIHCTGYVNITGMVNFTTGVAQWNGEGTITY